MPPSARENRLGKAVRIQRELLDLKRRDLAARSGLSYPYISEIENGVKQPSQSALQRIATALELEVSELARLSEDLGQLEPTGSSAGSRTTGDQRGAAATSAGIRSPRSTRSSGVVGFASLPFRQDSDDDHLSRLVDERIELQLDRFRTDVLPQLVRQEVERIMADREPGR